MALPELRSAIESTPNSKTLRARRLKVHVAAQ
jgi:hypothetical protein